MVTASTAAGLWARHHAPSGRWVRTSVGSAVLSALRRPFKGALCFLMADTAPQFPFERLPLFRWVVLAGRRNHSPPRFLRHDEDGVEEVHPGAVCLLLELRAEQTARPNSSRQHGRRGWPAASPGQRLSRALQPSPPSYGLPGTFRSIPFGLRGAGGGYCCLPPDSLHKAGRPQHPCGLTRACHLFLIKKSTLRQPAVTALASSQIWIASSHSSSHVHPHPLRVHFRIFSRWPPFWGC